MLGLAFWGEDDVGGRREDGRAERHAGRGAGEAKATSNREAAASGALRGVPARRGRAARRRSKPEGKAFPSYIIPILHVFHVYSSGNGNHEILGVLDLLWEHAYLRVMIEDQFWMLPFKIKKK